MLVGYARVSTADQDLQLQLDALKAAGCEKLFEEHASGARADREGLGQALEYLRAGDVLVVWKLDRLGRTVKGLVDLVEQLEGRQIAFRSLTDQIDTTTPQGRFFFHLMAALAEMERELIRERTRAGLEAAKRQGRVGGRPRKMTPAKIDAARKLLDAGTERKEVARLLGVSVSRLYHHLPATPPVSLEESPGPNPGC